MFDLLVKNAVLPDGRSGLDIGCKGDRIAAVERDISAEARQVVEAEGCLLYTSPSPRDRTRSRMPSSA